MKKIVKAMTAALLIGAGCLLLPGCGSTPSASGTAATQQVPKGEKEQATYYMNQMDQCIEKAKTIRKQFEEDNKAKAADNLIIKDMVENNGGKIIYDVQKVPLDQVLEAWTVLHNYYTNKDIKENDLNKMVDEIENVESVNLVLSPSELSNLAIPDEMIPDDVKDIFESDRYKMIFVNSTEEIATNKLNKVIDKIDHIIKKYDKNAIMAGEGPCMKDLVNIADEDFKNVSIASIGIIFIIMLFVLKSVSLPVLLVSGIELAIFINMAISYYTGDVLPFVASIVIGTIQLGATIDYAILLTTKYLENRKNGIDKIKAMDNAISNSAGSIFVSGMSFFAATFGVGMISKLNMIGSLCNLMSRGALISMFIVICVIPAILLVFDKVIIHTSIGFKQLKNNVKGEC